MNAIERFNWFKKYLIERPLETALLILVILAVAFPLVRFLSRVGAATYTFTQSSWAEGASGSTAAHPGNSTGWTAFSTSTNVIATAAGVSLSSSTAAVSARTNVTTNTSGFVTGADVAVDANGVVHVAYASREYNSNYYNIAYRNSTNWATRVDLTTSTTSNAVSPSIAIDSNGVVYVAYSSNEYNATYTNIAYRTSSNWATRVDVTTSATRSSLEPSLAIHTNGVLYIAYSSFEYDQNYTNLAYRTSNNWATRVDITTGTRNANLPSFAIDANGVLHVVYFSYEYNFNYTNIAYRSSANWATRVDLTTSTTKSSGGHSIAIDASNVVHVAYQSYEYNSSYANIAYRNSANWATRVDVTTSASISSNSPSLAVDASGVIRLAYYSNEYNATYTNIAYRTSSNWATRVDVTTSTSATSLSPSLFVASNNIAHIAYISREYSGLANNVAYRTYTPGGYSSSGSLTSSAYDSSSNANVLASLRWTEDASLPAGTTATLSLRTASSSAGLSSSSWSDFTNGTANCTKSVGVVTCSAAALPAALKDGSLDQWVQYKVALTSTGANTPTLSNVVITYVVNAVPEFDATYGTNGVTATQISDSADSNWGKIQIQYKIRDSDGDTGTATPGYVTPSFQYNTGSGWNTITSGYLNSGALDNKSVETANYTLYTALWDFRSQLAGTYASGMQIRVTVNDNEAANNTASATGSAFAADAKTPTVTTFLLDSSTDYVSLVGSDDSNVQYRLSNNADLSADGMNGSSGTWQTVGANSVSSSISWSPYGAPNAETVYYQLRDAYGNETSGSTRAPGKVGSMDIKDISNVSAGAYRLFVAWGVYQATSSAEFANYQLYRSTNGSTYTQLTNIGDINTNYYSDFSVSSSTTYYYKVRVIDTDGEQSNYSTAVSDLPDGQGGTDITSPVVTAVTAAEVQATWTTITWTTDELSNSRVEYSISPSISFNNAIPNTAYVTGHSVTLTGLTPNTTYLYRVKSTDVAGNLQMEDSGGLGYSFTTLNAAQISNVAVRDVSDARASITWNTDASANSYVVYASGVSNLANGISTTEVGSATLVTTSVGGLYGHRVNLTGLTTGATYYFYVKSTDGNSNTATDTNGGSYYSFNTTRDVNPPVISNIQTPVRTSNTIVVTWDTDEPANSQLDYGVSPPGTLSSQTTLDTALTTGHAVTLTSLTTEQGYAFQVKSADAQGNLATSDTQTASTTAPDVFLIINAGGGGGGVSSDITPPLISNPRILGITAFGATAAFETNEETIGFASYGRTGSYGTTQADTAFKTTHAIVLPRLQPGTSYHVRVLAHDRAGNSATSDDLTFTSAYAAESLDGLTKLENAAQFQDQLENIIESTMPSLIPPFIGNIKIDDITERSAKISWKTNVPSFGLVQYALDKDYAPKREKAYTNEVSAADAKSINRSVTLSNLLPASTYHFNVKAFALPGVTASSSDASFMTRAAKITAEISNLTNTTADVRWTTDGQTNSYIEFKNLSNGKVGRIGEPEFTKAHVVELKDLLPDTKYEIRAFGYDKDDNLVEGDTFVLRTIKDSKAPTITATRIDNALFPGRNDRLQTVVSWQTDEPATSQVYYEEGLGTPGETVLANKVGQENVMDLAHIVILTAFKPSTIYRIQIVSKDGSGNTGSTSIKTILTPQSAESVLDVIIGNLEERFGFLRKLQR